MDLKKIAEGLHPLERKVLPVLESASSVHEICYATRLKEVEVMRALQWMQNKKIAEIKTELGEVINLDRNGRIYREKGLPERSLLESLQSHDIPLEKLSEKTRLTKEEVSAVLGLLRQRGAVLIVRDKQKLVVKLTETGRKILSTELPEERFLQRKFPVLKAQLSQEELKTLLFLKKRKQIVSTEVKKDRKTFLTTLGRQLLQMGVRDENIVDKITPEIIKGGKWRGKTFRRFDIKINVPNTYAGRLNHYRRYLDVVKMRFLAMGFKEMTGPIVESDFWDMDALFMPQFHSARDIHQAYYVKEPSHADVEDNVLKRVKQAHENGFKTGSKGWRYEFDAQRTKRLLLRTQTTACSARMLASKELEVPGKYFAIARCFRYDIIDSTHLPDFNQAEGIVVNKELNLRHLFGLLKTFAKEFAGAEKIKIVPGYFPFTEPSAELFIKHEQLGWLEIGGAGLFRPEVVEPLTGRKLSVLAWGLGLDRIAMIKLGIKDIRNLFTNDLNMLRNARMV